MKLNIIDYNPSFYIHLHSIHFIVTIQSGKIISLDACKIKFVILIVLFVYYRNTVTTYYTLISFSIHIKILNILKYC